MEKKEKSISLAAGILLMVLSAPWAAWATGPRLTSQLFEPEGTIKIVAYEYPPLTTFEMPSMGLCSEIIREAFAAAGVAVTIENQVVRNLAVYSLIQDNSVAMIGAESDFSEDEQKQLIFMPCYTMTGRYFYYRPNHTKELKWQGKLDNLNGFTYGALTGEDVTAYKKAGIKIVRGDLVSLFKMLRDEKIDFLSVADLCGEWLVKKNFAKEKNDFAKMAVLSWQAPFSIIFNKKHPRCKEISTAFAEGFDKIKQNGKYVEIIEKYRKN